VIQPTSTVRDMALHHAGHQPRLLRLTDGRYAVHCQQCEQRKDATVPVGIGVAITNRFEAESIYRNHGGRAA
jgi:hypothetical protein